MLRDITIDTLKVANLDARTVSGRLNIDQLQTDHASLETTSGALMVGAFTGQLRAKSVSGQMRVKASRLTGDLELLNTSGGISLSLPADASFQLDSGSVSGRINCDFPVTISGTQNDHGTAGTVGGGKYLVHIRTVSGKIDIVKS